MARNGLLGVCLLCACGPVPADVTEIAAVPLTWAHRQCFEHDPAGFQRAREQYVCCNAYATLQALQQSLIEPMPKQIPPGEFWLYRRGDVVPVSPYILLPDGSMKKVEVPAGVAPPPSGP
jgi:hypothetical protein